tara:strand:+ start:2661 stop:5078 length:2418 start_codon:yes stop_codon:yes gene_type:complete
MLLVKIKRNFNNLIKKDYIRITFLIFISISIDYIWLDLYKPIPAWDQGFHLGNVYKYSNLIKDINIVNNEWWYSFWNVTDSYRGPLTYIISGIFTNFTKIDLKNAFLSNSIFNIIIIFSIFKFCQKLKKKEISFWACLLFTFNPFIFDLRNDYLIDLSQCAFILLNFYVLTEYFLSKNKSYFLPILSGILFGLLFLIKPTAVIYFILPFIFLIINIFQAKRFYNIKYAVHILSYTFSFILVIFPWIKYNWLTIITSTINAWNWGIKYQDGLEINTFGGWLYYPIQIIKILNPFIIGIIFSLLIIYFISHKNSFYKFLKNSSSNFINYKNYIWFLSLPINIIILNLAMSTKDPRFILPIIPFLVIFISFLIVNIESKYKFVKFIKLFLFLTVIFSLIFHLKFIYSQKYSFEKARDFNPNNIHKEIIKEVHLSNPYLKSTIGFLPDTKDFNAFNLDAEALKQDNGIRVSQIVSNQSSYLQDLNNFDWFIVKSGDQGVMSSKAKDKLAKTLINSEQFRIQKSWQLNDKSKLFLLRKKILNQKFNFDICDKKDISLDLKRIDNGFIIEVNGKIDELSNSNLIINFENEDFLKKVDFSIPKFINLNSSNNCSTYKGIYQTELFHNYFKNIFEGKAYILTKGNPPKKIINFKFSNNKINRNVLPKTNKIEQVYIMGQFLRKGQFDELFNLVGLINQSDPEQSYLKEAENIFNNRLLMESVDVNDLYALAISQILQKESKKSLITIDEILKQEPLNPYILLAKSVVEVYQFKFNQANNSIKKAILNNEDYKINETLNTIFSITKILSFDFNL